MLLYALPAAVLAAAWARAEWRSHTLRRALSRQNLSNRLTEATWARDTAALEAAARRQRTAARAAVARESRVLAEARAIVDAAYATSRSGSDLPGGTDV